MCTVLGAVLAAGTALSAAGSIYNGVANARADKVDQKVAALNRDTLSKTAESERLYADLSLRSAAADEARKRTETKSVIGAQRGYFAAANLDPALGSPLLLAGKTAAQGEVDAGLIRAQGELDYASGLSKAASTQAGAASSAYEELSASMRARQEVVAGVIGAGTAILGGVSRWPGLSGGSATYAVGAPLDIRPDAFRLS